MDNDIDLSKITEEERELMELYARRSIEDKKKFIRFLRKELDDSWLT